MTKYRIEKLDAQWDFNKWMSKIETIPVISDEGLEESESDEEKNSVKIFGSKTWRLKVQKYSSQLN